MLAWLLHVANSSPVYKDDFYAMKSRILKRFGREDGCDLQFIAGKPCWSCDGSGTFYHIYSGDPDTCWKCGGNGWYKSPRYVTLRRWRLGRFRFHEPIAVHYYKPPDDFVPRSQFDGYVDHRYYSYRSVERATFVVAFFFDWPLARRVFSDLLDEAWVVVLVTRRCADCRRRLWSTKLYRCRKCADVVDRRLELQRIRSRPRPGQDQEIPF